MQVIGIILLIVVLAIGLYYTRHSDYNYYDD